MSPIVTRTKQKMKHTELAWPAPTPTAPLSVIPLKTETEPRESPFYSSFLPLLHRRRRPPSRATAGAPSIGAYLSYQGYIKYDDLVLRRKRGKDRKKWEPLTLRKLYALRSRSLGPGHDRVWATNDKPISGA